jgi:2-dehydro-3-deoxygluconokinase
MSERQKLDLLCLGEPMVEFNAQKDGSWAYGFGGDVSNVAISAARQNAKVGILTRIGADSFGDDLRDLWTREGVLTRDVEIDTKAPTGIYFVRHGTDGHRFEYRRAGSAASQMAPQRVPRNSISSTRCLHYSGISQAISATALTACETAVDMARECGCLVSYDPNLRLGLWSLEQAQEIINRSVPLCDFFLPGLDDARQLTGFEQPEDIVSYYLDLGAGLVALTLGPEGALVGDSSGLSAIPPRETEVVDASGAGDCFDGAFLARLLAGDTPQIAAHYAVTASSISVEGYGAIPPIPSASVVHENLTV